MRFPRLSVPAAGAADPGRKPDLPPASPRLTRRVLMFGAAAPWPAAARAQPEAGQPAAFDHTLRFVVSAAAGASLDILARTLAPALGARLGQSVVVENLGGGGGVIAINQVARAPADGHTLLVTGDSIVLAEALLPNAGYAVRTSFAPVTQAIRASQILVTHPGTGIRTVQDYVARVRDQPGRLNLGLPGWGGIAHVISEMLNRQLGGLRVEYIPYRGGAPAALDLLAGQLDAVIITLPAVTEYVRQGRLVPLAVTTAARDAALPEVPTLAETVAPGFDVDSWQGLLAPAGTPQPVLDRLHAEIAAALRSPAVRDRLVDLGYEIVAAPPEVFAARLNAASQRFGETIRSAGITARG
ncbi:tripartite tricarboxylate transporter substrate-binding protein [Roseomonas sp. NAR14]|uniref:Tripartite tricarboxylate transporter substrate-binding protein n=1 Tax=Roseomonas acroporae TaxID=2937791 RepID=A0A9X2BWV3_9PROT|nr:tripartite tricarboxylate transporter substrate-binding protein [Roseomonas acroporae]MCK8784290.1 tripartite tricarboxylate transporter substrate-binding protein [Roseomonas acroporae]